MANTSRVPAVNAALVAALDAALDVRVYDGPAFGDEAEQSWVEVGVDDPETQGAGGQEAARSRFEWVGLGARSRNEDITVHCAAWAANGDGDLTAATAAAYVLFAAVEAAIFADPSLTGLALFGIAAEATLRRGRTPDGAVAAVLFDVTAKVRLSA